MVQYQNQHQDILHIGDIQIEFHQWQPVFEYPQYVKNLDVDLEYYRNVRNEYSTEEWVDLLIRSMEYNPEGFENLTQKLSFLSRLMVFVEARLNIIELALCKNHLLNLH